MAYQSQLKKLRSPNLRIYVGVFLAIFLIMFILFHYANRTEELYQLHRRPDLAVIESWKVCQENFLKKDLHQEQEKIIYVVTPTYSRFEQVAELTRFLEFIRWSSSQLTGRVFRPSDIWKKLSQPFLLHFPFCMGTYVHHTKYY